MRKKTFKRLRLRRETLQRLEAVQGAADTGGGYTVDTTAPGQCCPTVTNPPLVQSGACETRMSYCECNTARG